MSQQDVVWIYIAVGGVGLAAAIFVYLREQYVACREADRFSDISVVSWVFTYCIRSILEFLGGGRGKHLAQAEGERIEREVERRLREAGIVSALERGSFLLMRGICYLIGGLCIAACYAYMSLYYATVFSIIIAIASLLAPVFWIRYQRAKREEDIQRELPLLIDLTNLGVSAGWDVSVSLDKAVGALGETFPKHPLIREFKGAMLLAGSGFTWEEALERVSNNLNNDIVRKCALSFAQALKQGGDRIEQLTGVAQDAQRIYYASLEKRLAALPVKAVLITMVLMVGYMAILMAPAAVQIENALMSFMLK
ncbi:MAG: hypothetical protein D6808_01210 [Candidatus Dadabacteria bacterium]|nr:MAG: hypothetical protein D6808_01210 [Candidatus Dadabacteria bacterium]